MIVLGALLAIFLAIITVIINGTFNINVIEAIGMVIGLSVLYYYGILLVLYIVHKFITITSPFAAFLKKEFEKGKNAGIQYRKNIRK